MIPQLNNNQRLLAKCNFLNEKYYLIIKIIENKKQKKNLNEYIDLSQMLM